jgi:hypothetical protein
MPIEHLIKSTIALLVRHALTGIAGYLVTKGLLTGDLAEYWILAAITATTAVAWSLWNKYKIGEKLMVALGMPAGTTPTQLDQAIDVKDDPVALNAVKAEVRATRIGG